MPGTKGVQWKKWENVDVEELLTEVGRDIHDTAYALDVTVATIRNWKKKGQMPVGLADALRRTSGVSKKF